MSPETFLLLLALVALAGCVALPIIAYRTGRRHGYDTGTDVNLDSVTELNNETEHLLRDKSRVESTLRECQAQMMRGAAVFHHKRPNPHHWSDPELEVVKTEQGGLAFTDGEWSRARARYEAIKQELGKSPS